MPEPGLTCARPLMAQEEPAEYPYSFIGSCFVVAHRRETFAITAAHCLTNWKIGPHNVRIPYAVASDHFMPIKRIYVASPDREDRDRADLAIMRIDVTQVPEHLTNFIAPWLLPGPCVALEPLSPGCPMVCRRFPFGLGDVDHDAKRIVRHGLLAGGVYAGPSFSGECHALKFRPALNIPQIDGMSGSPVFARCFAIDGRRALQLAGMVIRGGRYMAHYIGWQVLQRALSDIEP